ncbi:MAG: cell division protein ZapA [Anaeromicrobium sp.]|jgi:cell division protein ZapA|uniref:cell division protein ZapA n=1 Tax=Anaeromicrobium sp. TaxID=1929132 RepID=UPI0025E368FC|nr:cell division protein ZapA [Anaeromicrobium sp.]MCT4594088.1 cell division protein ZapA [Anaeromicrobium sp.]
MSNKRKVVVKIYGQEYTMVGTESREYIQRIANYVDDKMIDVARKSNQLSTSMVAVLTSLNIADEYMKSREEVQGWKNKLEEPLEALNEAKAEIVATKSEMEENKVAYEDSIRLLEEEKKALIMVLNEKEEQLREIENLKTTLALKEQELDKLAKENEELQSKVFDSQIKYVQAKKELDSFIDTFDEKG